MSSTCKICHTSPLTTLHKNIFDDRYGYPGIFTILVCPQCGFGQLEPEPNQTVMQQIYTTHYPRQTLTAEQVQQQATFRGTWSQKLHAYLLGNNNIAHHFSQPGSRVLDIGCGDGTSLMEIKALGGEAYGTEYDENVRP